MPNQSRSPSEHSEAELLPCPFCASTDIAKCYYPDDELRDFVMCNGCGVYAQRCDCEADPVEVWNRRATPAEAGERTAPELPTKTYLGGDQAFGDAVYGYCDDDMTDYGQQCARYAVEQERNEPWRMIRAVVLNAKAVIKRWDSPLWRQEVHTAEWIDQLRKTIDRYEQSLLLPISVGQQGKGDKQ